ncbi:hypothetical protein [Halobacillus sp. Cin3]|uniref:hypothetical protein n=1 Tax=Halobacillus sp. Cin3 TaxID=2928441 RepID=UPI00248E2778|nr:hypothetical protein [Halobacillus sp. Cin3]
MSKQSNNGKCSFPDKKDMTYWIIILVLFSIGAFTVYYGSDKDVISHIGFGGTIVSILLALIAIIYSFYQSNTYENATHKLDTSAVKIEEATNKLSNVSEVEKVVDEFKVEVQDMRTSIHGLETILGTVHSNVGTISKDWESLRDSMLTTQSSNSKVEFADNQNLSFEYFKKVIDNGGNLPFFALELIDSAYHYKVNDVYLTRWTRFYIETFLPSSDFLNNVDLNRNIQTYLDVFIMAFNQVGFIGSERRNENGNRIIRVNQVNENLSKALDEELRKIKQNDPSRHDNYLKLRGAMEAYKGEN